MDAPFTTLTRAQMEDAIAKGGSVMVCGQVFNLENPLPAQEVLDRGEAIRRQEYQDYHRRELARLRFQLEAAGG